MTNPTNPHAEGDYFPELEQERGGPVRPTEAELRQAEFGGFAAGKKWGSAGKRRNPYDREAEPELHRAFDDGAQSGWMFT